MNNSKLYGLWKGWTLSELIGKDDFGEVYEATGSIEGQNVTSVIKTVKIPVDSAIIDKMLEDGKPLSEVEAYFQNIVDKWIDEIISRDTLIHNDHVVKIEDYKLVRFPYTPNWIIYIRLEKLQTLKNHIADVPVTENDVAKLGRDICNALDVFEKVNINIDDVSSSKIFVNEKGDYKIGGFGCAQKITIPGYMPEFKKDLSYLAPEVFNGKNSDLKSNLYSVGIIMYELLNNGRLPFESSDTPRDDAIKKRFADFSELTSPQNSNGSLSKIILKATAFNPQDRFSSFSEMERAITAYLENDAVSLEMIFAGKIAEVLKNDELNHLTAEQKKAKELAKEKERAELEKQAEAARIAAILEEKRVKELKNAQIEKNARDLAEEEKAAKQAEAAERKIALLKKKEEEQAALAEKRAAEEALAKKKADEEALAKKKAEEEALAKKKAAEQELAEKKAVELKIAEERKNVIQKELAERKIAEQEAAAKRREAALKEEAEKRVNAVREITEANQIKKQKKLDEARAKREQALIKKHSKEAAKRRKAEEKYQKKHAAAENSGLRGSSIQPSKLSPKIEMPYTQSSQNKGNKKRTIIIIVIIVIVIAALAALLLLLKNYNDSTTVPHSTTSRLSTSSNVISTTEPSTGSTPSEATTEQSTTEPSTGTEKVTTTQTTETSTSNPTTTSKPSTTKPTTSLPNHDSSSNQDKIVNGIYTARNGGFQMDASGWKKLTSNVLVPENYGGSTVSNSILIAIDSVDPGFSSKTKEQFSNELYINISSFERSYFNGYPCIKFKGDYDIDNPQYQGVKVTVLIFQTASAKYSLFFMQSPGSSSMDSVYNRMTQSIKIFR